MSDLGVGPLHLYPKPWEEVMEHGTPSVLSHKRTMFTSDRSVLQDRDDVAELR